MEITITELYQIIGSKEAVIFKQAIELQKLSEENKKLKEENTKLSTVEEKPGV